MVLEATLSGRRFRIDRSPAWTRPKKRGTGTTTEQARVVISERRPADDGQHLWHPLSTRLDEAGHLVTRLVGMTLPQFCQVAMLPQGRFQAFLRRGPRSATPCSSRSSRRSASTAPSAGCVIAASG